jgi:hypothetical protein
MPEVGGAGHMRKKEYVGEWHERQETKEKEENGQERRERRRRKRKKNEDDEYRRGPKRS